MNSHHQSATPQFFIEGQYDEVTINTFFAQHPQCLEIDQYQTQLEDLFEILHPELLASPTFTTQKQAFIAQSKGNHPRIVGNWVYLPWRNSLVHLLKEEDFERVRTNRNQLLITLKEQQKLRDFSVGIVGLSIGSVMAQTLARMGMSKNMSLVDFDFISVTNLNRLPYGVLSLGREKADEAARALYEIDPYMKLQITRNRLTDSTLQSFYDSPTGLKLVVDAIDDFKMKVQLRLEARKKGIPVVMLTSLGDRLLIDIERYDLDRNYPLFHGLVDDVIQQILDADKVDTTLMKMLAVRLVGKNNVPARAVKSLHEIGKTLVGRPQLYATVQLGSAQLSKIVRKIALGANCPSGRYKKILS